jgi:hypothetical protein
VLLTGKIFAQDNAIPGAHSYWTNIGIGPSKFKFGTEGDNNTPSLGTGISLCYYSVGKGLLSLHFIYNREINILGPTPAETVWDAGLLYGGALTGIHVFASFSGGISLVSGRKRGDLIHSYLFGGDYEKVTYTKIGLPIEGQLFWILNSWMGLGISGVANINSGKSFVGALFSVRIDILK